MHFVHEKELPEQLDLLDVVYLSSTKKSFTLQLADTHSKKHQLCGVSGQPKTEHELNDENVPITIYRSTKELLMIFLYFLSTFY